MGDWREQLWEKVADNIPETNGKLLEAGVGTGKNIQYYPDKVELYTIDFSEKMLQRAQKKTE